VPDRPLRLSDEDDLRRVEELANVVCDEALEEGWLTYLSEDEDQTRSSVQSTSWPGISVMSTTRVMAAGCDW